MKINPLIAVVVFPLFAFYFACTNLKTNQTEERFHDNMYGGLRAFSDISPSNPSSFSFAAMGDTHIGSPGGNVMQRALQMSQADGDTFAVMAGDNSNTGLEGELTTFNAQIQAVGLPAYPAIGNHDIFFGGWNNYKTIIGRSIYSINAGNTHLIFLDTANGTFGESQLNWLKQDLLANTRPVKVIVMHFPIVFRKGEASTIFKISSDEEASIFKSMMNEFGVQLVISGHYHGYSDHVVGGTRYMVTGAANNILDLGEAMHYLKVIINGTDITVRQVYL